MQNDDLANFINMLLQTLINFVADLIRQILAAFLL